MCQSAFCGCNKGLRHYTLKEVTGFSPQSSSPFAFGSAAANYGGKACSVYSLGWKWKRIWVLTAFLASPLLNRQPLTRHHHLRALPSLDTTAWRTKPLACGPWWHRQSKPPATILMELLIPELWRVRSQEHNIAQCFCLPTSCFEADKMWQKQWSLGPRAWALWNL